MSDGTKPQIIFEDFKGHHNKRDPEERMKSLAFKDLSTILICPCYSKGVHPKVAMNWMNIMQPMNAKFTKTFPIDLEVGKAYSETIEGILANPELSKWKYIATLEHDNIVDPDWLLKLYEDIEGYDAVGAIYYTKGEGGKPMCYGNPAVQPLNFIPFEPPPNAVTRCNGLGMGANLFRMEMFKDKRLPKPLFQTKQEYTYGVGAQAYTQDLFFFQEAGKLGYKFACSTRTRVGHMDLESGYIW